MASPYFFLLEALRAHCNLPEFPNPLPSNQVSLELQEGPSFTIDFNEETSMVTLFAELAVYDLKEELAVLSKIAQANFLWAATAGGTLSAHPETQTVYFGYQFPIATMEGPAFIQLVEKFAGITQQWKTILTTGEPMPSSDQTGFLKES